MKAEKEVMVFLALAEAMSELRASLQDDLQRDAKRTVNVFGDAADNMLRKFKRQGLQQDESFNEMVGVFIEAYSEILDQISDGNS